MKFLAPAVLGLLSLFSCGGGSSSSSEIPQAEACNQASMAACTKLFSCTADVVLAAAQVAVGGSVSACETYIKDHNYCTTFGCSAGQTYHGDKAKQCKDQFGTVSCATLATAAASLNIATVLGAVPVCQEICTGGDGGA